MKDSGQSVVVVVVQPLLDKVERKGGWNAATQRRERNGGARGKASGR